MNIDDYKSHGSHYIHTQINAFHHFVQGVVRGFPPANHHGTLTQGTVGDLTLEAVNDERNALVQQVVQVRGDTGHLHHHANLSEKITFSVHVQLNLTNTIFFFRLPKTGGPSYDGNGGSHFSWVYSSAR